MFFFAFLNASLFTFPTEKSNPVQRQQWVKMINRPGKQDQPWTPGTKARVCSKHFVDDGPSEFNPIPTLNLGYDDRKIQVNMYKSCCVQFTTIIYI